MDDAARLPFMFENLPTELQLKILSRMTLEELCETVLPVCVDNEKMESLVYDAFIRNEMNFYKKWMNNGVSITQLGRVLEKKSAVVTCVNVYPLEETHLPILNHLPSLSRLTTLNLKCYFLNYPIYALVAKCVHLKELWIQVTPGCVEMFSHVLSSLPHLIRLSVYLWGTCDEVDQCIHSIADQSPLLQRLKIITNSIRDDHLETLLFRHSVSLTHFKLNDRLYTNRAIEMISQCPNLTSLSIEACYGITQLSPLTSGRLLPLTSLHLCQMAQLPIHELDSLFLSLPQLTYLRLEHINLSEQMFINVSKNSPQLKTLIVVYCHGMTDPIVTSLLTCRQLQHVILYTNHQLTSDGIEKLSVSHFSILKVKNTSLCRGNFEMSVLDMWFDESVEQSRIMDL